MIIKKDELKLKTSEYIEKMIAKAEDYVAERLVEASAEGIVRLHIIPPEDIPYWAIDEVAKRYEEEGYMVVNTCMHSLLIVLDDEAYEKQKKEDSKRN